MVEMVNMVRIMRARALIALLILSTFLGNCQSMFPQRSCKSVAARPTTIVKNHFINQLKVRGGSDEESDEPALEELEGKATSVISTVNSLTKRFVIVLGKATIAAVYGGCRAVKAAFQGDEDVEEDEEETPSFMAKAVRTVKRMWTAAWNPPDSSEEFTADLASTVKKKSKKEESVEGVSISDFGSYLEDAYSVSVDRGDEPTTVMGGTIGDALREARSKARLLVVFIPSTRPGRGKKKTPDHKAIESLLSPEVAEVAEKNARKKVDSGSYVIWGAKASSPEAITAIKRLKAKQTSSKGDKRPVLAVAYPAQVLDSHGFPKLVPRLLAQHHCSPPPSPELMAAWLNALRKRHAKQYASMHHELKEAQLFKERTEGYKSSVASDIQRKEREQKEEEERIAKEQAEKERIEMIENRRIEIRESLPEEPSKEAVDSMTIALRFPDGRAGQRRFTPDTPMSVVFNWVDSGFEMEREKVVLSTMNGQKSFTWEEVDGISLGDSGLGRMTGLRVTIKKVETKEEPSE
jgi:hypothetical protein